MSSSDQVGLNIVALDLSFKSKDTVVAKVRGKRESSGREVRIMPIS